jgi:hypothetical protein
MVWLLIIFCLAVAVSPLMWMKSSPRQQQVMANRKKARSLTINVNICKQADASDSEDRLDAIFYCLDWQQDNLNESWVLHRRSNRGWESCFDGWRWINQEADKAWLEVIGSIIDDLPSGVSAIVTNKQGIGVVWDERGDGVAVDNLHQCLIKLRDKGKEICI